jgi:nitroreductase
MNQVSIATDTTGLLPEIENRRSLTSWTNVPISKDHWELMLEAARRAPSSWNHQPARYVLVTDRSQIKRLSDTLHRTNAWAEKAAALVVLAAAPEDDDRVAGKEYYLYDCGLSMMSLIYQAQALGITSRQMIGWDESQVKECLRIPDRYRVVVVTAIGYAEEAGLSAKLSDWKRTLTGQHKRYGLEHTVYWQSWGEGEINR